MRKTFVTRLSAMLLLSVAASTNAVQLDLSNPDANKLEAVVHLPIKSLKAVEANGEIFYMSENGRFVLRGQLYDIWYKDTLDTINQINDSATRIHFNRMGTNFDDFNTISIGTGNKQAVAFVDPLCTICHKLMADAEDLGKEYTFKFVVVPALGDESNKLARHLFCAENSEDAAKAYMNNTLATVAQKENCDTAQYDQTLLMAHLLDVKGVPFVVAPDGRYSQGRPKELKSWLEGSL